MQFEWLFTALYCITSFCNSDKQIECEHNYLQLLYVWVYSYFVNGTHILSLSKLKIPVVCD